MYFLFSIFFLIVLFLYCINHWRKKKIIKKICSMCVDEKYHLLNELIKPFGYSYVLSQDIFTSQINAWQREFGYCAFYDKAAPHFHMIFDCLPVYFDYQNKTWLIEFWKGQYGINTGCEIGVYHADSILPEKERECTLFECVDNEEMPTLSFSLSKDQNNIAYLCQKHWWLTAFRPGCFSNPGELSLKASITLQSHEMAIAFAKGLSDAGHDPDDIFINCCTVSFMFSASPRTHSKLHMFKNCIIQRLNRFGCRVYLFITKPFCLSMDRILYLYYYLPFAFRKMLRIRNYKNIM